MLHRDIILVTGGNGLVGRALVAYLRHSGFLHVYAPTQDECDLTNGKNVFELFLKIKPAYVFHLAGRVRGVLGNLQAQGAAYLENTLINTHVVDAAYWAGVQKIVAMGTVAMYPDPLPHIPLREEDLWQGKPHISEHGYAHAKRGMLAQLEAYNLNYGLRYAVACSTNLYGPYDNFDLETGHVIPSLIKKFYLARKTGTVVPVWGDGTPQRDFLHVYDCMRALVLLMDNVQGIVNVATGITSTIKDIVGILVRHTKVNAAFDTSKPSGQLVRSYDVSKLDALGFVPEYSIERGLTETYDWYASHATSSAASASARM